MEYEVKLTARVRGAIGAHNTEARTYTIAASDVDSARDEAIHMAYDDGLEHVTVRSVTRV